MLMAVGYVPDIDNPTVAELDRAAHDNAFAFSFWTGSAVFVSLVTSLWWAAAPAFVAIHAATAWHSCRHRARRLRDGTRTLPKGIHASTRKTAANDDRLAA